MCLPFPPHEVRHLQDAVKCGTSTRPPTNVKPFARSELGRFRVKPIVKLPIVIGAVVAALDAPAVSCHDHSLRSNDQGRDTM